MFPTTRLRRLRKSPQLRDLIRENGLINNKLIYPVFVEEEVSENTPISHLPGISRISEKNLDQHVKELYTKGIRSIILFGISHHKDATGSDSLHHNGLLYRMINRAKNSVPEMIIVSDNCFCEYTDHGHCGIVANNYLDNDLTLENLAQQAMISAQAGADIIAPSAMIDGQITAIRTALDISNFTNLPIMSYSTKFSSCLYGPFREAANSSLIGDRKTYQMDYHNSKEAIRESLLDEQEGADILMVKPAGFYLDIIKQISERSLLPLAAYQVSGEYAAIKFASLAGALNEEQAIIESLTAINRAGASIIISYFAPEFIKIINNQ